MQFVKSLIFILFLIVTSNGCCSYDVKPRIDVLKLDDSTIKNISLNYEIVVPRYLEQNEAISLIEQSLKELSFKEVIKKQSISTNGYFCQISVKYIGPRGAGVEWLTGLSLGIIPTWSVECDRFEFEYQLFWDRKSIRKASYITTDKCFNWILVAPLSLGNSTREKEVIKNMSRHFFSDLKL